MVESIPSWLISKGGDVSPDTALAMLSDHRIAMSLPSTSTKADLPIVYKIQSTDCCLLIETESSR